MAANSWMQHPFGYVMVKGKPQPVYPYARGSWARKKPTGCCPAATPGTPPRSKPEIAIVIWRIFM